MFVGYSLTQTRMRVKKLVCVLVLTMECLYKRHHKGKHKYIFSCAGHCPLYALSPDDSALRTCCAHGKCCLDFIHNTSFEPEQFSVRFMLNAMAAKNIGI